MITVESLLFLDINQFLACFINFSFIYWKIYKIKFFLLSLNYREV